MRKVYENMDFTRVGFFQSLLEGEGIKTTIKNLGASTVMGEIPFTEVFPELWVLEDGDYDRALEILREAQKPQLSKGDAWTCPKCQSAVDAGFEECWNCGTAKP